MATSQARRAAGCGARHHFGDTLTRYNNPFERLLAFCRVDEATGCWLWTGRLDRYRYGTLTMRVNGKPQPRKAHRVIAELLLGRALHPDSETIEHDCGVRHCINGWHLKLATRSENSASMRARQLGRPVPRIETWVLDRAIWGEPDPYADPHEPKRLTKEAPF